MIPNKQVPEMKWAIYVFVVGALAFPLSYVLTGWLQKPLNDAERMSLVREGSAYGFADLPLGVTHVRLERPSPGARESDNTPLVVLVHGYSTPSFVYDDYFAPLTEAGFAVLAFDLYGRGFSDRPSASYGVDLYAGQLESLLAEVWSDAPVHLVGYSMGGAIVTRFANAHPEQVASVTLIAPAGLVTPAGQGSPVMFKPLIGEWMFRVLGSSVFKRRLSEGFDSAPEPDAFAANFARQFDYRGLDRALLDTIRAFGRGEFDVDFAATGAANIPVQAYFAEDDSVIPIASADRLAELNPQADIHRFDNGNHAIGYGRAGEIASGIAALVGRTEAP